MLGGIENLNEKTFCIIQEYLTIREWPLHQVIALESNDVAFLFEWHYAEVIESQHGGFVLIRPSSQIRAIPSTLKNVD
jgi:hypothetical protein